MGENQPHYFTNIIYVQKGDRLYSSQEWHINISHEEYKSEEVTGGAMSAENSFSRGNPRSKVSETCVFLNVNSVEEATTKEFQLF